MTGEMIQEMMYSSERGTRRRVWRAYGGWGSEDRAEAGRQVCMLWVWVRWLWVRIRLSGCGSLGTPARRERDNVCRRELRGKTAV